MEFSNHKKLKEKEVQMNTIFESDETRLGTARQMTAINPAQNPKVDHRVREFLKALNSGGGKPIETLTPAEARKVLVDAQASVRLELPACDIEAKTITQDGLEVSLTIVRPAGSKVMLPGFIFVHGGGWVLGTRESAVMSFLVTNDSAVSEQPGSAQSRPQFCARAASAAFGGFVHQ